MSNLQDMINRMLAEESRRKHEDTLEKLLKIQTTLYDKASTYVKVILGLGYATFFALWSASQQHLTSFQSALSALSMTFSLLIYLLFEVFQMIYTGRHFLSFAKMLGASVGKLDEAVKNHELEQNRRTTALVRVWVTSLVLCIPMGVLAALILIYSFARRVWLTLP